MRVIYFFSLVAAVAASKSHRNFCLLKADGIYGTKEMSRSYYLCEDGYSFHRRCPEGRYFDNRQKICRLESPKGCLHLHASTLEKVKELADQPSFRTASVDYKLPDTFDARNKWENCKSMTEFQQQWPCESCWAVAAAASMTDRLCIGNDAAKDVRLSASELMTCCTKCLGKSKIMGIKDGCKDGGDIFEAFQYWHEHGLVSSRIVHKGQYTNGCKPYDFIKDKAAPKCSNRCVPEYDKSFCEDKYYGLTPRILPNDVQAIQKEIYDNGPVVAGFTIYEDFNDPFEVYSHKSGEEKGQHAIKLIGWGTHKDEPYWLATNSWGMELSIFLIKRGSNESGIENYVVAGALDPAKKGSCTIRSTAEQTILAKELIVQGMQNHENMLMRTYCTSWVNHRYYLDYEDMMASRTRDGNCYPEPFFGHVGFVVNSTIKEELGPNCNELVEMNLYHHKITLKTMIVEEASNDSNLLHKGSFFCAPRKDYCGADFELVEFPKNVPAGLPQDNFFPSTVKESNWLIKHGTFPWARTPSRRPCWIWALPDLPLYAKY